MLNLLVLYIGLNNAQTAPTFQTASIIDGYQIVFSLNIPTISDFFIPLSFNQLAIFKLAFKIFSNVNDDSV